METPGLPKRIQPTWLTFWNLREQVTLPAAPGPLARQAPKWEVEQLVGAGAVGEIAGVGDGWGSGEVSTLGVEGEWGVAPQAPNGSPKLTATAPGLQGRISLLLRLRHSRPPSCG